MNWALLILLALWTLSVGMALGNKKKKKKWTTLVAWIVEVILIMWAVRWSFS